MRNAPLADKYKALHEGFDEDAGRTATEIIDHGLSVLSSFLRDYQVDACRFTLNRMLKTTKPLLITLPTGSGKSWVLVGLSYILRRLIYKDTGKLKKVVMICPTPTLARQNYEKLVEAGFSASIFSGSLKEKDTTEDIIVGTPVSIANAVNLFKELEIAALFIDEAHIHGNSQQKAFEAIKDKNPNVRVVGLTATPFRLDTGYIFAKDTFYGDITLTRLQAKDPFYAERVFDINPNKLIESGYLTPICFGETGAGYDISGLKKDSAGLRWTKESEQAVFVDGKHVLTQRIINEVRKKTKKRKAVLIFAQSIEHANALKHYFSDDECGITHSNISFDDRVKTVEQFKSGKIKFLINVDSLTTGFDAPICDALVILRATESLSLFIQVLGRGMRLTNMKRHKKVDCLVLDYASNIAKHCPSGDPFDEEELRIFFKNEVEGGDNPFIVEPVTCPVCDHVNMFRTINLPQGVIMNEHGFMVMADGGLTVVSRGLKRLPISAHMGTRCSGYSLDDVTGKRVRCTYQWSHKVCDMCGLRNSAKAVICVNCHTPLSMKVPGITEDDIDAIIRHDSVYMGDRYCGVLSIKSWYKSLSISTKSPLLVIEFVAQEYPYLKGSLRWEVASPEPENIKIWLSPTINKEDSKQQWSLLCDYFFGENLKSVDEAIMRQPNKINYIVYRKVIKESKGQQKIFNEIVQYS
jgi:DNA repair protein RadD